jgi:hypothetical protein
MNLKEILDNAQFGDDVQFDFNGEKIPLKDLRALRAGIAAQEQAAAASRTAAEKSAMEAANVLAELIAEKGKTQKPAATEGGEEWEKDPLYAPILKKFSPVFDALKKTSETQAAIKQELERAQAIYAIDRMRGQFNARAGKDGKINGKTFKELAEEAVRAGSKDEFGAPTIEPIIEKLTEPDRLETYAAQKVQEERKKWEDEQRAAASSKPGSASRFRTVKTEKAPISKIEDLNSEAVLKAIQDDPAFAKEMETVQ